MPCYTLKAWQLFPKGLSYNNKLTKLMNVNIILGVLAVIGVSLLVFGNIVMDLFDWMIIDIYLGIVLSLMAFRFFTLKNKIN